MIVADANILAYLMIEGERLEEARQVRERDDLWRLPRLWRYEFTNVLTIYVRHRGMTERKCREKLDQAIQLFEPAECPIDPIRALDLALTCGISGYDAQYLALAEQLDVTCVSEDQRFRRAAPDRVRTMHEFLNDDAA